MTFVVGDEGVVRGVGRDRVGGSGGDDAGQCRWGVVMDGEWAGTCCDGVVGGSGCGVEMMKGAGGPGELDHGAW